MAMRRSADRDSTNLGYFEDDVRECLLSLTDKDFLKSDTYTDKGYQIECDVYLTQYTSPAGDADDLYVKFSFKGWVWVYSFHRQR